MYFIHAMWQKSLANYISRKAMAFFEVSVCMSHVLVVLSLFLGLYLANPICSKVTRRDLYRLCKCVCLSFWPSTSIFFYLTFRRKKSSYYNLSSIGTEVVVVFCKTSQLENKICVRCYQSLRGVTLQMYT